MYICAPGKKLIALWVYIQICDITNEYFQSVFIPNSSTEDWFNQRRRYPWSNKNNQLRPHSVHKELITPKQSLFIKTRELSWCQFCRHWWHRKLLSWKPPVVPVTTKSSWQLPAFSVSSWYKTVNISSDNKTRIVTDGLSFSVIKT